MVRPLDSCSIAASQALTHTRRSAIDWFHRKTGKKQNSEKVFRQKTRFLSWPQTALPEGWTKRNEQSVGGIPPVRPLPEDRLVHQPVTNAPFPLKPVSWRLKTFGQELPSNLSLVCGDPQ
jgi:hypothetical protein